MVWLHPLQRMGKEPPAFDINLSVLGYYGTFNDAPRPEYVTHGTPWGLRVRSIVGSAIFTTHEARGYFLELQVDQAVLIGRGFDSII